MAEIALETAEYRGAIELLESSRHENANGSEYWFAREIQSILGYSEWRNFEGVIAKARSAMSANNIDPSHHIVSVDRKVEVGSGAVRVTTDHYLSRGACYLIAMNGDPSKSEIAAAQAYFAAQTRARELEAQRVKDEKRLEMRQKVTQSFKAVRNTAKNAGVSNSKQGIFHNARYHGLYGMSARQVKNLKGIPQKENAFDRMDALELSAHDFQMNLAAETIEKESVRGEERAIKKNKEVAQKVRQTMIDSGARPPEKLPAAEPIKQVEKRVKSQNHIPSRSSK